MGVDHSWEALFPYLRERVRVSDLVWSDLMDGWRLPREHGYTASYQLLSDLGFENLIYDRWNIYKTVVEDAYPPVHASLMRIRDLISAELAN